MREKGARLRWGLNEFVDFALRLSTLSAPLREMHVVLTVQWLLNGVRPAILAILNRCRSGIV